ncbi:MAG: DNA repair protein RecO [Candidatus Neomarinimicrobiota bacterium]
MPLEKTEAVILRSFYYGDTSKIARCYTRDFGKVSIIAKGVRKSKQLQSGYIEPMNYLSLLFYYAPARRLQIFSKAEFQSIWLGLKKDVKKLTYGFAVVELIDKAVTGEEPQDQLFQLLVDILQAINDSEGNINLIFWYFEMHLLVLLGFQPILSECPRCHGALKEGFFAMEYGELVCRRCDARGEYPVSSRSIDILRKLKRNPLDGIGDISLRPGDRKKVGKILNDYLHYHIEGLGEVKSLGVMEKVLT